MFITYAQNYEDVFLHRCFQHLDSGRWIDVGAWVPEIDSVTKALSLRGWTGVNIEPIPQYFDQLVARRPNDINLQCALGREAGTTTINHIPQTGLSTVHAHFAAEAEQHRGVTSERVKVHVRTLNSIYEKYFSEVDVHFVKIDVEGSEDDVLAGFDLEHHRPWLLIIESNLPNSTVQSYEHWQPRVLAANYEFVFYDGLNRWFVAKEHQELRQHFELPLNLFDRIVTSVAHHQEAAFNTESAEQAAKYEIELERFRKAAIEDGAQIQRLRAQLQGEQTALSEVRSSRSWKATAPIRRLTKRRSTQR